MSRVESREPADRIILERHRGPDEAHDLEELRRGLLRTPKEIASKHFYDAHGSELFERICRLPEYYQTRTERSLLESHARRIARRSEARDLVEIGSGAATKTRVLLRALQHEGSLRRYIPFDVDVVMLQRIAEELASEFPRLTVHAIAGDFRHTLRHLPAGSRRLVIFLGGTIGNLRPDRGAPALLRRIRRQMAPGDHFLLGVDLIKERTRIEAAYNDSQGITAEFNRNILRVVNRLARANFDIEAFRHRAFYEPRHEWIEMRLVARARQEVHVEALGLDLAIEESEEIRTEISAKYDRDRAATLLTGGGFELVEWLTDAEHLFGLALAVAA